MFTGALLEIAKRWGMLGWVTQCPSTGESINEILLVSICVYTYDGIPLHFYLFTYLVSILRIVSASPTAVKSSTTKLTSHLSLLLFYFLHIVLIWCLTKLPCLASNLQFSCFSLQSSWDFRPLLKLWGHYVEISRAQKDIYYMVLAI